MNPDSSSPLLSKFDVFTTPIMMVLSTSALLFQHDVFHVWWTSKQFAKFNQFKFKFSQFNHLVVIHVSIKPTRFVQTNRWRHTRPFSNLPIIQHCWTNSGQQDFHFYVILILIQSSCQLPCQYNCIYLLSFNTVNHCRWQRRQKYCGFKAELKIIIRKTCLNLNTKRLYVAACRTNVGLYPDGSATIICVTL